MHWCFGCMCACMRKLGTLELPCECWELNVGPLEEQQMPLIDESSLQPLSLGFLSRVFAWLSWNYYVEQAVLNPQRSTSLCLLSSGVKGMHHYVWHILLFLTNYSSREACFPNTEAECQLPFIYSLIICFKYVPVLTQPACSI